MDELVLFKFEEKDIRTKIINNEVCFNLKDVCDVLELTNPSMVKSSLLEDGLSLAYDIDS